MVHHFPGRTLGMDWATFWRRTLAPAPGNHRTWRWQTQAEAVLLQVPAEVGYLAASSLQCKTLYLIPVMFVVWYTRLDIYLDKMEGNFCLESIHWKGWRDLFLVMTQDSLYYFRNRAFVPIDFSRPHKPSNFKINIHIYVYWSST